MLIISKFTLLIILLIKISQLIDVFSCYHANSLYLCPTRPDEGLTNKNKDL